MLMNRMGFQRCSLLMDLERERQLCYPVRLAFAERRLHCNARRCVAWWARRCGLGRWAVFRSWITSPGSRVAHSLPWFEHSFETTFQGVDDAPPLGATPNCNRDWRSMLHRPIWPIGVPRCSPHARRLQLTRGTESRLALVEETKECGNAA